MDLRLDGKRAIVTGGSRGLGKEIARTLAREGVSVAIGARGVPALEATAEEIAKETGGMILPIGMDACDDTQVKAFVSRSAEALGGIDIIVNNAAIPNASKASKVGDIDREGLLKDFDTKLCGYIRIIDAALPYLLEGGWGRIINIGGLGARVTGNYMGGMRTAVISTLSKNLADELGRKGITANTIHPGFIRPATISDAFAATIESKVSIGRPIEAEEIGYLVAMLASPRSESINGQTIQAGGGLLGGIDY